MSAGSHAPLSWAGKPGCLPPDLCVFLWFPFGGKRDDMCGFICFVGLYDNIWLLLFFPLSISNQSFLVGLFTFFMENIWMCSLQHWLVPLLELLQQILDSTVSFCFCVKSTQTQAHPDSMLHVHARKRARHLCYLWGLWGRDVHFFKTCNCSIKPSSKGSVVKVDHPLWKHYILEHWRTY